MKDIFIERYKDSILNYFSYPCNGEGRMVRNFIVSEYGAILREVFGMKEKEISQIYQELYNEFYFKGGNA